LHGLSVLTLLVLSTPVLALAAGPVRTRLIPVALAALTLGGLALFGVVRLSGAGTAVNTGGPYVAVVDAGFTQREKWDPANRDRVAERYLALLDDPAAQRASVIVWPEGALPFPLLEDAPTLAALEQKLGTRALATGLVRRDFVPPDQSTWFNSLIVMSRDERGLALRSLYDKNHLVPFGEYVPLGPLFDALGLRSLVSYGVDFTPGPPPAPIAVPGLPEAWPLICYEAIFPVTIPDSARPGWLLNVSVDAWFGQAQGPAQHFNQARYRAIETGLPLVRSASGGPSGIVDGMGRVIAQTEAAGGVVSAPLPPKVQRPLQLGIAYFPGFLIVLCLSVRLVMIVSHRRLAQSAREEMPNV
jgi:apolipoprotein N-acyltransferase